MTHIFETVMVICFGLSWPLSVYKSWKSRTTQGKSLFFEVFIWLGYVSAIVGKIYGYYVNDTAFTLAFYFYILNIVMVSVDLCLYARNSKLDKTKENAK